MPPTLMERIQTDMTAAMKSQDADTLSTLRMLKTALMEAKTKKPKDEALTGDEEIEVAAALRQEAPRVDRGVPQARPRRPGRARGARDRGHAPLPAPVALRGRAAALMREAVARPVGAAGPKDMGKVIGAVMAKAKGRAEGGMVSRLVKEALGA